MATHKKKNRPKQQMCYGRLGRDNGTRTHDLCNVTVWHENPECPLNTIVMKDAKNQKYSFSGLLARF